MHQPVPNTTIIYNTNVYCSLDGQPGNLSRCTVRCDYNNSNNHCFMKLFDVQIVTIGLPVTINTLMDKLVQMYGFAPVIYVNRQRRNFYYVLQPGDMIELGVALLGGMERPENWADESVNSEKEHGENIKLMKLNLAANIINELDRELEMIVAPDGSVGFQSKNTFEFGAKNRARSEKLMQCIERYDDQLLSDASNMESDMTNYLKSLPCFKPVITLNPNHAQKAQEPATDLTSPLCPTIKEDNDYTQMIESDPDLKAFIQNSRNTTAAPTVYIDHYNRLKKRLYPYNKIMAHVNEGLLPKHVVAERLKAYHAEQREKKIDKKAKASKRAADNIKNMVTQKMKDYNATKILPPPLQKEKFEMHAKVAEVEDVDEDIVGLARGRARLRTPDASDSGDESDNEPASVNMGLLSYAYNCISTTWPVQQIKLSLFGKWRFLCFKNKIASLLCGALGYGITQFIQLVVNFIIDKMGFTSNFLSAPAFLIISQMFSVISAWTFFKLAVDMVNQIRVERKYEYTPTQHAITLLDTAKNAQDDRIEHVRALPMKYESYLTQVEEKCTVVYARRDHYGRLKYEMDHKELARNMITIDAQIATHMLTNRNVSQLNTPEAVMTRLQDATSYAGYVALPRTEHFNDEILNNTARFCAGVVFHSRVAHAHSSYISQLFQPEGPLRIYTSRAFRKLRAFTSQNARELFCMGITSVTQACRLLRTAPLTTISNACVLLLHGLTQIDGMTWRVLFFIFLLLYSPNQMYLILRTL